MPRKKRFKPDPEGATIKAIANPGKLVRADFHKWLVSSGTCVYTVKRSYPGSIWQVLSPDGIGLREFWWLENARSYVATGRADRDMKEQRSQKYE